MGLNLIHLVPDYVLLFSLRRFIESYPVLFYFVLFCPVLSSTFVVFAARSAWNRAWQTIRREYQRFVHHQISLFMLILIR